MIFMIDMVMVIHCKSVSNCSSEQLTRTFAVLVVLTVLTVCSYFFSDLAMLVNPAALRVVEVGQRLERRVESGKMSPEFLRQVNCKPQQLMLNNSQ